MANLVLMAGPNGAGKTTTALELLRDERRIDEFVNADIIAAEGKLDDIAAGRQMLLRIKSLVAEGRGVAFETILALQSAAPAARCKSTTRGVGKN